jgi:hypothetical protein
MSDARLQLANAYQGRRADRVVVGAELQPSPAPTHVAAFGVKDALTVIASIVTIVGFLRSR